MAEYTIREIADKYKIPASTLRYYEDLGLLENVTHTDKNQRIYTEEHMVRLDAIQCFKQTGLPLSKIQDFFRYAENLREHIDPIVDMMQEHEKNVIGQIEALQEGLSHIQHKVRFYTAIQEAIRENRPWPKWGDFYEPKA